MKIGDLIYLYYREESSYIVRISGIEHNESYKHGFLIRGTVLYNKQYIKNNFTGVFSMFEEWNVYNKKIPLSEIIMIEELWKSAIWFG